ncbi:MAG: recombinase family protein, partial [Firmicutes bacterium]|nr:recombinase family protein [Bacillota bacterium]
MKTQIKKYKAAVYVRLSKEDAVDSDIGKTESDSISNQKALITNFVKGKSDITVVDYYVDDGYTGVLFERPEFVRMLNDINAEKINCVIVKDLSRFGREYINAGRYMQKLFPSLGVRFIAI